jgi:hypothetical protein
MKKPQIECLESPSMPLYSHNRSSAILAAFLAALCAAAAIGGTLDTTPFSKKIPITISGYAGSTELTDFPVLVTLAENAPIGFSYDDCATGGADLRFADATGALLPHEIETWDTKGTSCIWVKVPSIVGKTTKITCFYGADGAATLPTVSATDVWSSYAAVFHGGTAIADATGKSASIITPNGATADTTGGMAGGVMKKGDSKGVQFSNPVESGALSSISKFSFSGWFKKSGGTTSVVFSNKGNGEWNGNGFLALVESGNYFSVGVGVNGSGGHQPTSNNNKGKLAVGTWGHLAFSYDKAATSLDSYFNGDTIYSTSSARNILDPGKSVWAFGGFFDGNKNCFQGDMDEVRVLNGSATADWIKAEYDSVATSAAFAVPGTVEAVDHTAPVLATPVLVRNADGSFTVSVEVSESVPDSIVCTAGGTDFTMTTSDTALPATYAAVVSGLAAGTCTATVRATATSGTEVSAACPTAFHVGALVATVVADADEGTLSAGTFRIARADADATGLPALTVGVAFSGPGLAAVADPEVSSVTIPAGEASVDLAVAPVFTAAVDADATLVLTVSGDTVGTASTATMTVVNATFDPAVRYVATTGDDANHGGTPELPKATIAAAVASLEDIAQTTPCTVHVAPGLYPFQSELSIEGAIRIIGEGDTVSSVVVSNAHESGYARQNQRVFVINNADALIANLTMQKGEGYGNQDGGNFYIGKAGGMVSNCVVEAGSVRDNARAAGGWLEAGLVTHTIFRGNKSKTESGSWADNRAGVLQLNESARAENCLFTENSQDKPVTLINVLGTSVMRNCTIVNSGLQVTNAYCKSWSALNINSGATVQNVVIAGVTNTVDGSAVLPTGTVARFANGAVDGDISELAFPEGTITGTAASFFKDYANGDYTPKTRGPLVNKGANYEGMASVDLAGKKRLNGKIDIGCYETSSSALMIVLR